MSLALEFLTDYLSRTKTTQADFAKAAGIDPSLFTKLIQQEVGLNAKNMPKLLRGIHTEGDRLEFVGKYLQEQIPADLTDGVTIRVARPAASQGALAADPAEESLDAQILHAVASLPSDLYRRRLLRFLGHLKKDASLRDLFTRTVSYLEESDHTNTVNSSSVDRIEGHEDLKRQAKPNPGAGAKAASSESKPRRTRVRARD